jgi:purine-nucleoside phosphorylase
MSTFPGPAVMRSHLDDLESAVRRRTTIAPRIGLVLGSGLGAVAERIEDGVSIPFADLPGWPAPSAPGHRGALVVGLLEGSPVACLQGRLHLYEGLPALKVVEPVLLLGRLGADVILLTNAAGGVNPAYAPGTLMVIADHLNLTGQTPLLGPNDDAVGPRFVDLTHAWDPELRARLHAAGEAEGVPLEEGVYAGLTGPQYETSAEVRMLRALGADAVGMSTVMEVIAARWLDLRVCGISLITNPGAGLSPTPLSHEEVLAVADETGPSLGRVITRFVADLHV